MVSLCGIVSWLLSWTAILESLVPQLNYSKREPISSTTRLATQHPPEPQITIRFGTVRTPLVGPVAGLFRVSPRTTIWHFHRQVVSIFVFFSTSSRPLTIAFPHKVLVLVFSPSFQADRKAVPGLRRLITDFKPPASRHALAQCLPHNASQRFLNALPGSPQKQSSNFLPPTIAKLHPNIGSTRF
jgi:hypothetical protein